MISSRRIAFAMNTVTRLMSAPFPFLLPGFYLILRDGRHNQYLLGVLNCIMNNQLLSDEFDCSPIPRGCVP